MSRINSNIPSLQAVHRLVANQNDLTTSLERLSTGLRINRGKDDPAGLIASETLRNEIRGIGAAIDNSERAINVLSVAEGSLNEVSSLLLDLQDLIVRSANDGAISDEELKANQLQIDSIIESIDRIANTTQFAGEKLINGNLGYTLSGLDTGAVVTAQVYGARLNDNSVRELQVEVTASAQTGTLSFSGAALSENATIEVTGRKGVESFSFASGTTIASIATSLNASVTATGVSATANGTTLQLNTQAYGTNEFVSVKSIDGTFLGLAQGQSSQDDGVNATVLVNGQQAAVDGKLATLRGNGFDVSIDLTAAFATANSSTTLYVTGGGAKFQIGPDVNVAGRVDIGIPSIATTNLGDNDVGYLNTIKSGGSNSIIDKNFSNAESILNEAISQVATLRGRIGGIQKNQLETNINSQRVALENVTAAESNIRDTDYASEVANLTRAQILVQSTTRVLGLANSIPQNVLSLLG